MSSLNSNKIIWYVFTLRHAMRRKVHWLDSESLNCFFLSFLLSVVCFVLFDIHYRVDFGASTIYCFITDDCDHRYRCTSPPNKKSLERKREREMHLVYIFFFSKISRSNLVIPDIRRFSHSFMIVLFCWIVISSFIYLIVSSFPSIWKNNILDKTRTYIHIRCLASW